MKIEQLKQKIVCDTVNCWQTATIRIETDSYKGNMYLCEKCFKELSKIFKGNKIYEKKQ